MLTQVDRNKYENEYANFYLSYAHFCYKIFHPVLQDMLLHTNLNKLF